VSSRTSGKSQDAYRTISEVAAELDVPQHVLRFWETKFSQIRPMKRSGGRRYYRSSDVDLLRNIRTLLYQEGYTIKGVAKLLKEQGVKAFIEQDFSSGGFGSNDDLHALREELLDMKTILDQAIARAKTSLDRVTSR
jgi:DNA-binding transcriptional MerR regulator